MTDQALSEDYDLVLDGDGNTKQLDQRSSLEQRVRVVLATQKGSHPFYRDVGLDRDEILRQNTRTFTEGTIIRAIDQSIRDTEEIIVTQLERTPALNTIDVSLQITLVDGTQFVTETAVVV